MATVVLENVNKVYDNGYHAIHDLSLDISDGEFLVLVGPSGCGKSTALRMIAGLETISNGDLRIGDRVVNDVEPKDRDIAMVFQDPYSSLNPRRTVQDQIAEVVRGSCRAQRRPAPGSADLKALVADVLERVGLDPALGARYPHALSGGQRQRVAIAKVLAVDSKVIVADEPISALDASSQKRVAALLRELVSSTGIGMAIISHDLAVVASIADSTAVMRRGEFVEQGPTERVWTAPTHPYTGQLLGAVPDLVRRAG